MWGLIRRAVVCRPDVGVCFHLSIYLSKAAQASASCGRLSGGSSQPQISARSHLPHARSGSPERLRLRPAAAGSPEAPLIARSPLPQAAPSCGQRAAASLRRPNQPLGPRWPAIQALASTHALAKLQPLTPLVLAGEPERDGKRAGACVAKGGSYLTATYSYTPQRLLRLSSHRRRAPVYGKCRGLRRSTSSECWRSSRARSSRQCRACRGVLYSLYSV